MPRKKKSPSLDLNAALDRAAVLESGAGNLSPELLAEIQGGAAGPVFTFETEQKYQIGNPPKAVPEDVIARLVTLESRIEVLEAALEQWAKRERSSVRFVHEPAAQAVIASSEEQATYTRTNFALFQDKQPQYDGIAAWRSAGSPVLTPREEEAA